MTSPVLLYKELHEALVELGDFLDTGVSWVARTASVCIGGLCEELNVLFLEDALEVLRNSDVMRELLDLCDGCESCIIVIHSVDSSNTHSLADCTISLSCNGKVVLKACGKDDSAGDTVRCVIESGKAVSHAVNNSQAYI